MWKNIVKLGRPHVTNMAHAGDLRLQIYIQNVYYLLLFHCNCGCTNAPQCYVIRTLPVLFHVEYSRAGMAVTLLP